MATVLVSALVALTASGCAGEDAAQWGRFGLPEPASAEGEIVLTLWRGSWIAALVVGVTVWSLIFFAAIAYRRRAGDQKLPAQVRYNVPIEVLYTSMPLVILFVLFYFTARDETELLKLETDRPHTVNVVGKRWSWDFNYEAGDPARAVYETGTPGDPPTLVLPRGERVEFVLTARDVIHSWWVPAFLIKHDTIPGRVNKLQLTPTKVGTFAGRCAELCGEDHSRMLFTVRVVEPAEYDAYLADLRQKGQTGELPADIGPKNVTEAQKEAEVRQ